jgi:hypothetical protein
MTTYIKCAADTLTAPADRTIEIGTLHQKAVAYLLQYGLNKSLQDSVSGHAKVLADLFANANIGALGKDGMKLWAKALADADVTEQTALALGSDAFADMVIAFRQAKRLAAILAGRMEVGTTGARLSGIDKIMHDIAIEDIRKACVKARKTMPTGEALAGFVTKLLAKADARIRAEAMRRMALDADAVDLDDLAGDDDETKQTA